MLQISRKELERISRSILRNYLALCQDKPDHIDPVDFTKKICGLDFQFCNLSYRNYMKGLSIQDADKYGISIEVWGKEGLISSCPISSTSIFIDERLLDEPNAGLRNFTMMHETAHRLLEAKFSTQYKAPEHPTPRCIGYDRSTITNWYEWQTDVFASYLLLPRELIHKHMKRVGFQDNIRLLNRVFAPRDYERFCNMADALGVSKTALSIRLDQMGLISRNDFRHPYDLVSVYPEKWEVA